MHQKQISTEDLAPELNDDQRFATWYESLEALTCCVDISRFDDRPFSASLQWAGFQDLHVTQFGGSFSRIRRSRSAIARDLDDDFCLVFHRGDGVLQVEQAASEINLHAGGVFLGANGMPADMKSASPFVFTTLTVSRDRLAALVGGADNLLAKPLDPSRPAVIHLRRSIESAVALSRLPHDPQLDAHINRTLFDLVALALGARGDVAELAATRGLRASRTQDILAEIDKSFTSATFSAEQVARRLQLSPRYVQDLLHQTGQSFTERLLERRLQHARFLLTSPSGDRLKISEIARLAGSMKFRTSTSDSASGSK